jgi:hypothetical protein
MAALPIPAITRLKSVSDFFCFRSKPAPRTVVFYFVWLMALAGKPFSATAQDRCGFDLLEKRMLEKQPGRDPARDFERWMLEKLKDQPPLQQARTQSLGEIPVVVHVIHNGVGTPGYLSRAQVLSQLRVINEDFKRLNADRNQTPAVWQPIAGQLDITFVLARRDPLGLPTNGIVYVRGRKTSYDLLDDEHLYKSLSYWPAEQYLNIWVMTTSPGSALIGLATFPEASSLPGLEDQNTNRLTDGLSIDNTAFGSVDDGAFLLDRQFDRGRTVTHELGHFFGLRHIWGDVSGCAGTDFVDDTPRSPAATRGCPNHPLNNICNTQTMFQNFLDLTDDRCMNLFTQGQVARMQVVLNNSPRRGSLLNSPGAQPPPRFMNDLLAHTWVTPGSYACVGAEPAAVSIINAGLNRVTQATIEVLVNNTVVETRNAVLDLDTLQSVTLDLDPVSLPAAGAFTLTFRITSVNGVADGNPANNTAGRTVQAENVMPLPLLSDFESGPQGWHAINIDGDGFNWTRTTAPHVITSNQAFTSPFYFNPSVGTVDVLFSPVVDVASAGNIVVRFDRTYARFPGNSRDTLKIIFQAGCRTDLINPVVVYQRAGSALATVPDQTAPFVPSGASAWVRDVLSLGNLTAAARGRIGFVGVNGNGNDLFVDNIEILGGTINDLAVVSLESPGPVVCETRLRPRVRVQNLGTQTVTRLEVTTSANGRSSTQIFSDTPLTPGAIRTLALAETTFDANTDLLISISNPDAPADDVPANNAVNRQIMVNTATDRLPLRQNFDAGLTNWVVQREAGQVPWTLTTTHFGQSAVYTRNAVSGAQSWLVSPVLDLSRLSEARVFFDVAYARHTPALDNLRVLASQDCGLQYPLTLYNQNLDAIASATGSAAWVPATAANWRRQSIDLTPLAGRQNVRLAWVITNDNGNNVFLDNLEFFIDNNPAPPRIEQLFVIYANPADPFEHFITFNLPRRETLALQIYNMMGQTMLANTLPDVLNQTYTLDLSTLSTGVYIFRIQTPNGWQARRVFVGR